MRTRRGTGLGQERAGPQDQPCGVGKTPGLQHSRRWTFLLEPFPEMPGNPAHATDSDVGRADMSRRRARDASTVRIPCGRGDARQTAEVQVVSDGHVAIFETASAGVPSPNPGRQGRPLRWRCWAFVGARHPAVRQPEVVQALAGPVRVVGPFGGSGVPIPLPGAPWLSTAHGHLPPRDVPGPHPGRPRGPKPYRAWYTTEWRGRANGHDVLVVCTGNTVTVSVDGARLAKGPTESWLHAEVPGAARPWGTASPATIRVRARRVAERVAFEVTVDGRSLDGSVAVEARIPSCPPSPIGSRP